MRRSVRRVAAAAMGALLTAGLAGPAAAEPGPGAPPAEPAPAEGHTVRLVTGDAVTVLTVGEGRQVAQVSPAPDREDVLFHSLEVDGELTVLPADAWPLVAAGVLDRRLFNVSALIEQGYDTGSTDALPLLVGRAPGVSAAAVDELTALHEASAPSHALDSLDARSVRIPEDRLDAFWAELAPRGGADVGLAEAARRPRVLLDARVTADLDRSTAQINAPAAWEAGLDGAGVRVAVLDTGADADHPDLAGRIAAAEDFSNSGGAHDAHGHGTHVAATVGGSGAGSDGARRGVAPGAELLVGKVLGDNGSGSESQVIAGMEWAAEQGADVVNMSLGSDAATDGTDPMSQALNALSAETDTLFVVAAGNNGQSGPRTVGSPGAADAALTVGAVDRDDVLAPFSSRGPRPGDGAVKPDVTAPGVDIVAARAEGTALGSPVDDSYTAASGTSMATPHVAGAAALLAQQRPDWDATALKDALISTSLPAEGAAVTEQGGGRIDLATATGGLTATGTVALGPFTTEQRAAAAEPAPVRYRNTTEAPVTLDLDLRLATSGGRELPADAVALSAEAVTVAPGESAEVTLAADPAAAPRGDYYGRLTARSADGAVTLRTTVSLVVNGPTHTLTPTVITPEGEPSQRYWPLIWSPDGFVVPDATGPARAEVEEGTYMFTQISSSGHDPEDGLPQLRAVYRPEVEITEDTEVTLDLREVTEVDIRTPRPAEQRNWSNYQSYREFDGHSWTHSVTYPVGQAHLLVSPTEPVTEGSFEFASRWQLVAPLLTADVPGSRLALTPWYLPSSSLFDERERLRVADAGSADDPDFSGVRGRLALVTGDPGDYLGFTRRAEEAGARGVLMVADEGQPAWSRYRPNGSTRTAVPLIRVGHEEGNALRERATSRRTEVTFRTQAASPYLYDVMQVSPGYIPERVVHTVNERASARIDTRYTDTGEPDWASAQRISWRPHQGVAMLDSPRDVVTGTERTEYVTAGDTVWQHFVHFVLPWQYDLPVTGIGIRGEQRDYRAGERLVESWFEGPVRPAIPAGDGPAAVREGDTLSLRIPEFTDADGHTARPIGGDAVRLSLSADGEPVGEATSGHANLPVPAGPADYRLDLTTGRSSAAWAYSTATTTSWRFRSETATGDEAAVLPLLQLDYDLGTGADNALGRARAHTVEIGVRHQDGLRAPRGVRLAVEASWDGGASFVEAERIRPGHGDGFRVTLERPRAVRGDAPVTLRVTARDAAGNRVTQTVENAYLHRG
ncbi:S8 family serine peptidase [Streptomyces sp. 3MP-14]|uniref:S8 family serine peptidase n=1 Tax=Streptomyces mimosae TaxID=2586635 RepID=A0A5N6AQS6_9ACTN|nr:MULTISPECIES: S8 family serine peptidase [Streptomyces]KAB8170964.1 S8 family serine peptidase [Streptomyces mimosae]KAB8179685.1 S8 family serine peptidase [Streptomyces sp. 3MP-14]